jgi:tetratricopeptide (TPR) repeat protein
VALLAGEPGIGKTRLAAELAALVHDEGAVVLAGRCDEDLGVPYQPFVEALRHYLDHAPDLRLGRYGGELVRLVPEVADRVPDLPPPLQSDPETERYRLFDALASWLAAASAEDPVLLVLDDLQWAAKPTLMLLRHVARSPQSMRLLVLALYRDTELDHDHPLVSLLADLRREGGVERFSLLGLGQLAVTAFVEQAAGHELDEDALALARAIHEETEGNPFFVKEVLRHLAESRVIEQRQGRWVTRLPIEEVGIPEGVREVVGKRLSRLSAEANGVLRAAAVVGAEFEPAIVQAAGEASDEQLMSALEEGTGARLLLEADDGRYRFAHALVRDTLYHGLTAVRRTALHRRVAEAIEDVHASRLDDHLPALAHHWARAGAPATVSPKAVDYAARAGDRALVQLANDEAVAYYRQALELLDLSQGPHDESRRLELLISLGEAQRRAGDPAHREHLLEAARLAQLHGDAERLARAALANCRGAFSSTGEVDVERVTCLERALETVGDRHDALKARLFGYLALELTWGASLERRMQLSDEAVALARRVGDLDILSSVLHSRAAAIWDVSTVAERLDVTAEALTIAERLADPQPRFWALYRGFVPLLELGRLQDAERHATAADQVAEELGQPFLRMLATYIRATWLIAVGQLADSERLSQSARALGEQAGQPDAPLFFLAQTVNIRYEQGRFDDTLAAQLATIAERFPRLPLVRAMLALALLDLGQIDDARSVFNALAVEDFGKVPRDNLWSPTMAMASTVCAALRDEQRAISLYDFIVPYEDLVSAHALMWFGAFSHYLGMLDATLGRLDDAAERFSAAASTHARAGARVSEGRTRLEWAAMLLTRRRPGDAERARELLGQALAAARELGLATVERRAVELLA